MQPFKPYFRGEEKPPHVRLTSCQKVLPHDRHRERRPDRAPPDVLRDARQLLVRRLLQAGRGGVRLGAVHERASASTPSGSGSRSSAATTSSASGPTRRRSPAGTRSACPTSGSSAWAARTTSGSRARPGRAGRARSSTSTAGSTSAARTTGPGDDTERFLEFWNLVFMQYELQAGRRAAAAARAEHRHRPGPRPDGRDPPGRPVGLRDRALPALHPLRRGAVRAQLRPRRRPGGHARAADPRRPRPRHGVPDGRRRRALERGPRLHPAPDHAAGDPAGPRARDRASRSSSALCDVVREVMGGAYPQLARRARHDREVGGGRGGGLRPHARRRARSCSER